MKNVFYVMILLVYGCSEESHQAFGSDNDPPGKVTITSIENVAGGAIIKFTPPSDEDLLYIIGKYENEKGEKKQAMHKTHYKTNMQLTTWAQLLFNQHNYVIGNVNFVG